MCYRVYFVPLCILIGHIAGMFPHSAVRTPLTLINSMGGIKERIGKMVSFYKKISQFSFRMCRQFSMPIYIQHREIQGIFASFFSVQDRIPHYRMESKADTFTSGVATSKAISFRVHERNKTRSCTIKNQIFCFIQASERQYLASLMMQLTLGEYHFCSWSFRVGFLVFNVRSGYIIGCKLQVCT